MLYKVDRMSMKNGLEVRVPYLDHELVDFVFSLPSEWKLKGGRRKSILRDALKDQVPDKISNRKKKGFEVPLKQWLNGPLKQDVDEVLNAKTIGEQKVLNYATVKNIIDKSRGANPGNAPYLVWALLVFQYWMNTYKPHC
jgi:asparagine synthase (glutamine-hydrolysing)